MEKLKKYTEEYFEFPSMMQTQTVLYGLLERVRNDALIDAAEEASEGCQAPECDECVGCRIANRILKMSTVVRGKFKYVK